MSESLTCLNHYSHNKTHNSAVFFIFQPNMEYGIYGIHILTIKIQTILTGKWNNSYQATSNRYMQ